jgi:hypothetical protein
MLRIECVLCRGASLVELFSLRDYPITPSSSTSGSETDEVQDCRFAACSACGAVQLMSLIDPVKLYEHSHNSTENTPTWKEHHKAFSQFIAATSPQQLLEIGGNSGTLYTLLSETVPEYSILDICDSDKRPPGVRFFQGNCETFDLSPHTHIAMSHTFEHLYFPRRFVENIAKAGVKSIYISIPNMEHLLTLKNISVLHNEHTYFVAEKELSYLFSLVGYSCKKSVPFKKHSTFYHFIPSTVQPVPISPNPEYAIQLKGILSEFERCVRNITINKPFFICPGGHYGQKIAYYLKPFRQYLRGFLDNDSSKQGLRVYGTDAKVYSPEILREFQHSKVSVILYAGPYTEELKRQLNLLHSDIEYINCALS